MYAQRDDFFPGLEKRCQLLPYEKVDQETCLRSLEVTDREAAVNTALDDFVRMLDMRSDGIHSDAEETPRLNTILYRLDVGVSGGPVAMLKDLDADCDPVSTVWRQC